MINVVFMLLKEVVMGMVGRVLWKSIGERFATRLIVYGLGKLKDYSTNDVVDGTVDDIVASLKGKKLKVIEDRVAE